MRHLQPRRPPCLVFLTCFLLLVVFQTTAVSQEKRHILVLHSYNKGLNWTDNEDEGIKSVLQPRLDDIEVHTEYMDTKRVVGKGDFPDLFEFLAKKYASIRFICIICSDDDAFNFILLHRGDLFSGVPVVFCGVNYLDDSVLAANRDLITGVVEDFDLPDTLLTALRLQPDTARIVVINDRTTTGLANRRILDRLVPEFDAKVKFEFFDDLSMAELQNKVRALEKDTIILLLTFNRDRIGHVYDYNQSISLISQAARVPMYGVWEFYLGKGIVGGMLTSGRTQGRIAAEMALRILDGQPVRDIPVVRKSPNRYMFDYMQLQRFDIDAAGLPKGSILINQPVPFLQVHPQLVWAAVVTVIGLILIILQLLAQIRERRQSLKKLEWAHHKTVTILESITDGFIAFDRDFRFIYVNTEAEKTLGQDREDLLGRSYWSIFPLTVGTAIEDFYHRVMETGEAGEIEYLHTRDGGDKWISLKAYPAEDGGISSYFRDITVEKRLEKELRQAQKMEAIGTLAGGIAHDFNNILSIIIGYTEMARMTLPQDSPIRDNLQRVLDAGSRATGLVKQILTFSRQTEKEKKPVQFDLFVKEALTLMRPLLPTTIAPERTIVLMDPTEIHQVLMNLCTNAAHAMRDNGGLLSIKVSEVVADTSLISRHPDLGPGHYVCLSVSDTGHGMEAEVVERIFDPYFTTKELGVGTGLGLPVVQGIVKGHHGALTVCSKQGKGTTFNVFLPRIEGGGLPPVPVQEEFPPGTERILFVDDEDTLAELGTHMLQPFGYSVTMRTSSQEALETFRADPGAFDLLITDMTMPVLTGKQLAREIKSFRPDMPVILCTGFSELINETQARESGIDAFLMKPYAVGELVRTIHRVLKR